MNRIKSIFLLLLMLSGAHFLTAQSFTVWPGDANSNGLCNNVDLLYIGIGFNATGPPRNSISIFWNPVGIPAIQSWGQSTPSGNNYVYMDCDGNGSIGNTLDLQAIQQNYGLDTGGYFPDNYLIGAQGDPVLSLQASSDTVMGGDTVFLDIMLGTFSQGIDSLYGMAFSMEYDTALVDTIFADFRSGWLGTGGIALIQMDKMLPDSGRVDFAVSRVDGTNSAGFGYIGSIGIAMDDNLKTGIAVEELSLQLTKILGITRSEIPVAVKPLEQTLFVLTDREVPLDPHFVKLYPNPVQETLIIEAKGHTLTSIELRNSAGQMVRRADGNGQFRHLFSMAGLPSGLYWISIGTNEGMLTKKVSLLSY